MFIWNIVLLMASVLIITSSMVFVYVNSQNRIISLAQPVFLYLIGFGSLVTSSSNLFKIWHCCTGIIWCYFLGQIITSSALFCKLWRVEKVTQFRRKQQIFAIHVIWPFITSLFIAMTILSLWTAIDPPKYNSGSNNYIYNSNDQDQVEWGRGGHCNYRQKNGLFFTLMVTINIISQLIAVWMAYKTRHIREDVSDSKQIFQLFQTHLLLNTCFGSILVAIELTMMARGGDETIGSAIIVNLLWTALSFLVPMATVGFLIIPKAYHIYYETKFGQLPNGVRISGAGGGVTVVGISTTTTTTYNEHHNQPRRSNNNVRAAATAELTTEFIRVEDGKDIKNLPLLTTATELPTIQMTDIDSVEVNPVT